MRLQRNSVLLVKYGGPDWSKWCEYRANRGRSVEAIAHYFRNSPNFKCLIIYDWIKGPAGGRGSRGYKSGYIDLFKIEY